ncbi:hypothetical protein D9M72_456720 [compost metagenome]
MSILPGAFAIHGTAGGQDDPSGQLAVAVETVQELGGADHIDVRVPGGLFQGLTGPGFRRQVDNDVGSHVLEDGVPGLCFRNIRNHQFRCRVQLLGPLARGMNLRVEIVDDDHAVELADQGIGDRTADEPGAARDEDGASGTGGS